MKELTEEELAIEAIREEMEKENFQTKLEIQVLLDDSGLARFYIVEKVEGFVLDHSRTIRSDSSEGLVTPKQFLRLLKNKLGGVKFPQNTTN